jgi:diketogulonate reductase-like aldo/keto reductase
MSKYRFNRRDIVKAGLALGAGPVWAAAEPIQTKAIPATGEALPIIGLGTYKVFDVWGLPWEIRARRALVDRMIERGASLIDSSPQYAPAEEILGDVIEPGKRREDLFLATKVWTDKGKAAGESQMAESAKLMHADVIDLMQVHNLIDTDSHMATIREWQADGRIRYNGITDWQASAHSDVMAAMQKHRPQFVQINYSIGEREADERLLPMAQDMGIAVLVNRPYMHGNLFRAVKGLALPDWAREFAASWGQFFLKFIVSHPAIHCAIPATSDMDHLDDNLDAGTGLMPDAATRARMAEYFDGL